jgi:hypothetical protein
LREPASYQAAPLSHNSYLSIKTLIIRRWGNQCPWLSLSARLRDLALWASQVVGGSRHCILKAARKVLRRPHFKILQSSPSIITLLLSNSIPLLLSSCYKHNSKCWKESSAMQRVRTSPGCNLSLTQARTAGSPQLIQVLAAGPQCLHLSTFP